MDYYQLRDQVWPYGQREWGYEKRSVRDYLKRIWMDNNITHSVETTLENVRRECTLILEWWWKDRYGRKWTPLQTTVEYGEWLLLQYHEAQHLDPQDHKGGGPR